MPNTECPPAEPDGFADSDQPSKSEEPSLARLAVTLKTARERLGLSVRQVHESTGISSAVLYGYESGKTKPGAREITLLCKALKITPNALLFGNEDPFGMPADDPASRLARLTEHKGWSFMAGMFLMPAALSALDYEDRRTLFSVALALIQAKQPELGQKVTRALEHVDNFMLARGLTWESLGGLTDAQRMAMVAELQAEFKERDQQ